MPPARLTRELGIVLVRILAAAITLAAAGYVLPSSTMSPIPRGSIDKIDPQSFWYYPWGIAGVHKGIDIFSKRGTRIVSPVSGFVITNGTGSIAGHYIYIIGAKWRIYYFAHMDTVFASRYHYVAMGDTLGTVGNTGNAAGTPPHLHYSIRTVLPAFWRYDKNELEGWQRTFYLDPAKQLGF